MKPLIYLIGGTTLLLAIGAGFRSGVPAPEEEAAPVASGPAPLNNLEPAPLLERSERPVASPGMTGALAPTPGADAPAVPSRIVSLTPLLRAARAAAGLRPGAKAGPDILMRGLVQASSETSRFHLLYNARGCYLQEIEGPVTVTTGFDGNTGWELATSQRPHRLESSELAIPDSVISVLTGRWLAPKDRYSLSVSAEDSTESQVAVRMQARGSDTTCLVQLHRSDWLPHRISLRAPGRTEIWRLDDYRSALGRKMPHQLTRLRPSGREQFRVQSIVPVHKLDHDPYQATRPRMAEIAIDEQKPG